MINLDSILKIKDITLSTKVHLVKAMVFPVVMYGCVHRMAYDELLDTLDIGSIVYPRLTIAEDIVRYVRAMSNSLGSNVETLHKLNDGRVEALEFWIQEDSPVVGVPLMQLNLKHNLLVACINRQGKIITPRGQDMIQMGDTVIVITTNIGLHDIKDILR